MSTLANKLKQFKTSLETSCTKLNEKQSGGGTLVNLKLKDVADEIRKIELAKDYTIVGLAKAQFNDSQKSYLGGPYFTKIIDPKGKTLYSGSVEEARFISEFKTTYFGDYKITYHYTYSNNGSPAITAESKTVTKTFDSTTIKHAQNKRIYLYHLCTEYKDELDWSYELS